MKYLLLIIFITSTTTLTQAQFHTLKMPQHSNLVQETQRLGVTDITIRYSSPSVNGRDVWNDPYVIPQNAYPIAWRAGANLNTTIEFSTDVKIEGKSLKAGKYGFHIIPRGEKYTLLFAHNNEQWGSYYLDTIQDVTLKLDVQSQACPFSEKLDYEFISWNNDSVVMGLEWADRRIPFTISVDLEATVIASFRNQLRGAITYNWQVWNDAAQWCYVHQTNLEEGLSWANRSINGGFTGFAANKNMTNLTTKAKLLEALDRQKELEETLADINTMPLDAREVNDFGHLLLQIGKYDMGVEVCSKGLKTYNDDLMITIRRGVNYYYAGNVSKAVKDISKARELAPDQVKNRLSEVITEMENGNYQYPYM